MPPRDPHRVDRVAAAVREEVAAFLARDAKDPRITAFVTVTAVDMTRDLRHATVYVSVMGTDAERVETFDGLAQRRRPPPRPGRARAPPAVRARDPLQARRIGRARRAHRDAAGQHP